MAGRHVDVIYVRAVLAAEPELPPDVSVEPLRAVLDALMQPAREARDRAQVVPTVHPIAPTVDDEPGHLRYRIVRIDNAQHIRPTLLQAAPEAPVPHSRAPERYDRHHRGVLERSVYVVGGECGQRRPEAVAREREAEGLSAVHSDYSPEFFSNRILQALPRKSLWSKQAQEPALHHGPVAAAATVHARQGDPQVLDPLQASPRATESDHHVSPPEPGDLPLIVTDRHEPDPAGSSGHPARDFQGPGRQLDAAGGIEVPRDPVSAAANPGAAQERAPGVFTSSVSWRRRVEIEGTIRGLNKVAVTQNLTT